MTTLAILMMLSAQPRTYAFQSRIPSADVQILAEVAAEYGLAGDARKLLFVIYICERGGPGREMGVLTPQAQRYKGDHARSLRLQSQWAAGTIRKRWTGDLEAFGNRWCPPDAHPLNKNWLHNARALME